MKTAFVVTLALLVGTISGCIGYPSDEIGPGDTVIAQVTITDDLGAIISTQTMKFENQALNFKVGSGASGLGFEFERALFGAKEGDVRTFTVSNDASLGYTEPYTREAVFGPNPLVNQVTRAQFMGAGLGEPTVGLIFSPPGLFQYEVVAIEGTQVFFKVIIQDDDSFPLPELGGILIADVDEAADTLTTRIMPVVGAVFRIQANPGQAGTPLDLPTGSYLVVGGHAGSLELKRSSQVYAAILPETFHVTAQITLIQQGSEEVSFEDGNVGKRVSPYINGQPTTPVKSTSSSSAHVDDGHQH